MPETKEIKYLEIGPFKKFCEDFSTKFNNHTTQLNGLYFARDGSGNWGYKTSSNGTVTKF